MKKPLKILCICLTMIISFTIFVSANSQTKDIKVLFNNIKILINKETFNAKDVNDNNVEPFIYNGTTYLPVRAIANAFDKDVSWNAEASTVILESKKEIFLDSLPYISRFEYPSELAYVKASETSNHGIEIGHWNYEGNQNEFEKIECKQKIVYNIENYKNFETIVNGHNAKLNIYCDNKLMYNTPILEDNSDINITYINGNVAHSRKTIKNERIEL